VIIGRCAELAVITDAIAAVSQSGSALVIDGEAGIGKSTLLSAAADRAAADGYGRLGCSGLQSQAEVGFAGVHELIHPLLPHARELPVRQRSALMTAFGLEDGPAPDRLLVSLAVLGLLEEAAGRRRLILIIDDVQWLDQSSLDVLAFVARRLVNAPLLLLCAERTTIDGPVPQLEGLPRLSLGPLPVADADQLLTNTLDTLPRDIDAHLRRRVLEQSNGNPLAVIELTAAIGERGSTAVFAGEPLPTSRRVERAFLNQLEALPEGARQLLLLISASDGSMAELDCAATFLGLDVGTLLDPLERASLITLSGGRIQVRHPLIRSTVYGAAGLSERALVHRTLATTATDPTRAAWHRAEAAFGPDEAVAADLENAADQARSRGAAAEAAGALRRAAILSPDTTARVRRLSAAAEVARSAGLTSESISILAEAEPLASGHEEAEPLAITRFILNATAAIPGHSAAELVALAGKFADDEHQRRELLWAAAIECRMHGLPEDARLDVAHAIATIYDGDDALLASAGALVDDIGAGQRLRPLLPRLLDEFADQPLVLMAMGFAAEAVAERGHALSFWLHVGNRARHSGSAADECESLRGSAQLLLMQGRLQAAAIAAENATRMAADMNLPMTEGSAAAFLARALAWQGHPERARRALDQARAALARDPSILWNDDAHWAAGMAALCASDHVAALGHLRKMSAHRTSRRWAVADLAEAAAGCDRPELARSVVAEIATQAHRLGTGLELMLVHRAQALLADTDVDADAGFLSALAAGEHTDAGLEVARTHLLYGEWLRRHRRIVEARAHLSLALSAFDAAGAAPFVERAAAELRAAGVSNAARAVPSAAADLTAQELQIAQLAASGLTNREIADRIYVSHKTVAAHLYKVFPKLGITSRSQLHAALGQLVI
jgi:DNA-binding CsgD family transcriptional regulator